MKPVSLIYSVGNIAV